jgi:hypothetical protein
MSLQNAFFTEEEIRESQIPPFIEKEWRQQGYALVEAHDKKQWELGDWMSRGVDALTKKKALKKAVQITKYAQTTLWDFARTAKAFEDPNSRRRDLSWSHYKELAIAELDDEMRMTLLERAETDAEGKWSVQKLRTAIRMELKRQDGDTPDEPLRKMQVAVDQATFDYLTDLSGKSPMRREVFVGRMLSKYIKEEKDATKAPAVR